MSSKEEIIRRNIAMMLGRSKGQMQRLMGSESMGGNAGFNGKFPCMGLNFYYSENGEIKYFENPQNVPDKIKVGCYIGTFRYCLSHPPQIIGFFPGNNKKSKEAESIIEESVSVYNNFEKNTKDNNVIEENLVVMFSNEENGMFYLINNKGMIISKNKPFELTLDFNYEFLTGKITKFGQIENLKETGEIKKGKLICLYSINPSQPTQIISFELGKPSNIFAYSVIQQSIYNFNHKIENTEIEEERPSIFKKLKRVFGF